MNKRYHHQFIGADNVTNRFEIWTDKNVQSVRVEASAEPFLIEYAEAKKLEPVRGSQATMELVSQSIFQFVDLHTDTMQDYLVKFYRDEKLYWVGWLDSELYNEQLSSTPPYYVTFTASDFNIWERLKYRDEAENAYTDIASLMTHLKRCFDALKLPFNKLYIGCTTVPEGIRMAASETALHVLYMMSANFYDEDAEPMAIREVVENILRPFGLMMVQKDANVYIYDYNTVKRGLPMKRYDFSSWSYEAEETVNFNHGNLPDIGFMSTDSSYGFEEMINNVTITSSLYGEKDLAKYEVVESKLSDPFATGTTDTYVETIYNKCDTWDAERFVLYKNKKSDSTLIGALLTYTGDQNVKNKMSFYAKNNYLIRTEGSYYINVLTKLYINTREDPFSEKMEEDARTRMAKLYCDLILCDSTGLPIMYYCNWYASPDSLNGWKPVENGILQDNGKFVLKFSQESVERGRIANTWLANSIHEVDSKYMEYCVTEKNYQKGISLPVPPASGYLKLDFINCIISDNALKMPGYPDVYPADKVRNLLINNVEISIKDADGKDISTDDYEFKSYVNKKVATDLADITLKCISANEEKAPVGKANMLRKADNRYELQLSFTRSGQTDILERLLMCTIHSNFATKKEVFTVDIKMRENPALSFVSYSPILSDKYLISGCKLNFQRAVATLTAVGYSDDVARLSSIPYD